MAIRDYHSRVRFEEIAESHATWWIDFLGEHNHVGGAEATRWLMERSGLKHGERMLDAGGFVGAAGRLVAARTGARVVVTDAQPEFLRAGRAMEGGRAVEWMAAANERLPFGFGAFRSVWCLDTAVVPKELTRVAAPGATLCLGTEAPSDGRGGLDAFLEEWEGLGWELRAHRPMSSEATQTWRAAEAELVRKRPYWEDRYGKRDYLGQLDLVAQLVHAYERGEMGHGLFVFERVR
jgi:hypothetical protein